MNKPTVGEILEKQTRVLTEEEKAQLDVPFVGRDGSVRRLEVCKAVVESYNWC